MVGSPIPSSAPDAPERFAGRIRASRRRRYAVAAASALLAIGAVGCAAAPAATIAETSPSPISRAGVSAEDICARADSLIADGAPREALEVIDGLRSGAPEPTPAVTRRTLIPPTPTATPEPVVDCESERLAALDALGADLAPTSTPAPTAAESFRTDWDRTLSQGLAPVLPAVWTALGGIVLLLLLAAVLAATVRGYGSTAGRALRRIGLLLVVVVPIVFAATLPTAGAAVSTALAVLGIVGALLLARHDRLADEVVLRVTDEGSGLDDTPAAIETVRRVGLLLAEGYGPVGDEGSSSDRAAGAPRIGGLALIPALGEAPGLLSRVSAHLRGSGTPSLRVLIGRAGDAAVLTDPRDRASARRTATVDAGRLVGEARDAGLDIDAVDAIDIAADARAAAVLEVLSHPTGDGGGDPGRVRSIVLQRLASGAAPAASAALLAAAAAADPADLRVGALVDARLHRDSLDPLELAGFLQRTQSAVDAALQGGGAPGSDSDPTSESSTPETVPSSGEMPRPGWESWVREQLLTAAATALDLRALTGVPTSERVELDARRLVRFVAAASDARSADAAGPGRDQMLAGVYFCELFPAERGSGSAVARWADTALTDPTPEIAYAVACSFSSGWRDDMAPYLKVEIERRIADRLQHALPDDALRARALVDPVLRRHATHPWYLHLVAAFEPQRKPETEPTTDAGSGTPASPPPTPSDAPVELLGERS